MSTAENMVFTSELVTERGVEQGKFVIGMDCKKCGKRHYGKSYQSTNLAFMDALKAARGCCK